MKRLKNWFQEQEDDAISVGVAAIGLFVVGNLLFAAKSMLGIDLFPDSHAGTFFAAGRSMFESTNS